MANADNAFGFLPVHRLDGLPSVARVYQKAAADGTALGIGDLVNITGVRNIVTQGAAGGPFLGTNLAYGAASTLTDQPIIICDKDTVLVAQEDGDGGAMGTAAEGLNVDVIVAAASTLTGRSQMEIDSSTANTTPDYTLDLLLYKVAPYPDNDGTLTNARWFVVINDSTMADLKAGV